MYNVITCLSPGLPVNALLSHQFYLTNENGFPQEDWCNDPLDLLRQQYLMYILWQQKCYWSIQIPIPIRIPLKKLFIDSDSNSNFGIGIVPTLLWNDLSSICGEAKGFFRHDWTCFTAFAIYNRVFSKFMHWMNTNGIHWAHLCLCTVGC